MTKNYYRREYTDGQWAALVDQAEEFGCKMQYSKYGNYLTIDSTNLEDSMLAATRKGEECRLVWAEHIHNMIECAAKARKIFTINN